MSDRVLYLVDGFNLYHSIRAAMLDDGDDAGHRWLDLPAFCRSTLSMFGAQRVHLERVVCFTALATHMDETKPDHTRRHRTYISALEAVGVEVVMSRFKKKMPLCRHCGRRSRHYEEKETDVALAVRLIAAFAKDECDAVALVTGDTDILPALRAVKLLYPERTVGVVFPYRRHSNHLALVADRGFRVGHDHYAKFQFPAAVPRPNGTVVLKPFDW